jgi:hypothetical protein
MTDHEWLEFFTICAKVLGPGNRRPSESLSWCSWTTFSKLSDDVFYWQCGLPPTEELLPSCMADGGTWRQSFFYQDIAHIVLPRTFRWETTEGGYKAGVKSQDLDRLSQELTASGIKHRITELVLEIKLY